MQNQEQHLRAPGTSDLGNRLKQAEADYVLAVNRQDDVARLETGLLSRAPFQRRDDQELAIGAHGNVGADALEPAIKIVVLYEEGLGPNVVGMRITKRRYQALYRGLGENLRIEFGTVNMLVCQERPDLPYGLDLLRDSLGYIQRHCRGNGGREDHRVLKLPGRRGGGDGGWRVQRHVRGSSGRGDRRVLCLL